MQTPYLYLFDASALTDGQSYRRLSVELRDRRDFRLRRIAGVSSCAADLRLYYPGRSNAPVSSAPVRMGAEYLMAPELVYSGRQDIVFDLGAVARATTACGASPIYTSRIAFAGVRDGAVGQLRKGQKMLPFTLRYRLNLDWYRYVSLPAAVVEPLRLRSIEIDTYDFELQRVRMRRSDGVAVTNECALQLLDSVGEPLSNAPVLARHLNNAVSPAAGWLTPGVVYPVRRQLSFWVESLLCNLGGTQLIDIDFEGVQWLP